MINHKLLCLLEGRTWDETLPKTTPETAATVSYIERNPDYSSPNTYLPFLQWLWKERRGMWDAFLSVHPFAWDGKAIPYLFSLIDEGEPCIMVLLSEWLALPEVKEKWGWEECEACGGQGFYCIGNPNDEETWCCEKCDGRCKVKAEWAKEVKDAD